MKPNQFVELSLLMSLFELDQAATAADIFSNVQNHRYWHQLPDRASFDVALTDLLAGGYVSQKEAETIEMEYAAYGRIVELSSSIDVTGMTEAGLAFLEEMTAYAAQLFVDEVTWAEELTLERNMDQKRRSGDRQSEEDLAQRIGFPYDILRDVRQAKRGRSHIYVVLLQDSVRQKRGVTRGSDPSLPAVYVGLTGLSPEQRFLNHKAGHKAGRGYVRDYGICLLPHLYQHYNPVPRRLAAAAEEALAEKLRLEGYTVLGGH